MDQVSLPMRIALLAVLAFAGLWLVALRPKPGGSAAPPVQAAQQKPAKPAPKGVTGAAAKADKAVAGANASTAKREAAAAKTSEGKPAAAKPAAAAAPVVAAAKPAVAAAKPDTTPKHVKTILGDVEKGKVVVLLFWNSQLDDDREVRRAVDAVDRRDGKVVVRRASIFDLGDYEPITRGVPVVTSPTTLVIDRDRRARSVSGLTVTRELDQLVGRALSGK